MPLAGRTEIKIFEGCRRLIYIYIKDCFIAELHYACYTYSIILSQQVQKFGIISSPFCYHKVLRVSGNNSGLLLLFDIIRRDWHGFPVALLNWQ